MRYIETTLTVPASTTRATSAAISLGNQNDGLVLWVKAGGGAGSIDYWWTWEEQGHPLAIAPDPGDQVTVNIYNDHPAKAYLTAVDHTQGTRATEVTGGNLIFTDAHVTGGGPTWSLASSNTRLWAFKDTRVTSVNGTHGTLLGPWPSSRIIGTRGAASTGAVVLWPTYPWNNGHNFSVMWRAAS